MTWFTLNIFMPVLIGYLLSLFYVGWRDRGKQ